VYTIGVYKMDKQRKKSVKGSLVNMIISAVIAIGITFLFRSFNATSESWFFLILFFLVLVYLELPNKIVKK